MIRNTITNKKNIVYVIPSVFLLWSIFILHLYGPFYLNRTDPEYPYLLNGLNCATLDFYKIGHIDHPGTPFQLLTGIFLRITYWIAGHGEIVDDVITRPEFYLSWSAFYLSIITSFVILWLGRIVLKSRQSLFDAIVLQSVVLLSAVLIDLPSRYIPDRFMSLLIFMFTGLVYKYFYQEDYRGFKFSIHAGILMAVGFITKINFLPILVIPFIIGNKWKERFFYVFVFLISSFILFLPVLDKFSYFKGFVTNIVTHDGLYGSGTGQVFNYEVFWNNIWYIFSYDVFYLLVFILSFLTLIVLIFWSSLRKERFREFLFLVGFILASVIAIIMIAKHYKNYYVIPIVSLSSLTFIVIYKIYAKFFKFNILRYVFGLVLLFMFILPLKHLYPYYNNRYIGNYRNEKTNSFIKNEISNLDYFFIEPTWMAGPLVENGLVYGFSYVNRHNFYYNNVEKHYPEIITWEGKNKPVSFFRMLPANNEAIFKSGKSIYLLSTPGRYASFLCNYLDSCSLYYDVQLLRDTVFINSDVAEFIIRYSHGDNWHTKININCGFEKVIQNRIYTDDGLMGLNGNFTLSDEVVCSGLYSCQLDKNTVQSPKFIIAESKEDDFIELSIKRRISGNNVKGELILEIQHPDTTNYILGKGSYITQIDEKWEFLRLNTTLEKVKPGSSVQCYYQYTGDAVEYIDDMSLKVFREN